MYGQIKKSHSIDMLSIQIDTSSLELVSQQHQIVLLCKPYETEFSIFTVLIDTLRILGTLL